jgi:hypothetical protein
MRTKKHEIRAQDKLKWSNDVIGSEKYQETKLRLILNCPSSAEMHYQ